MPHYLHFHDASGMWRVRIVVPPPLVAMVGKPILLRSTGTSDRGRAERVARPIIREFHRQLDKAAGRNHPIHLRHSQTASYSSEWYTPEWIFEAMPGVIFDLDPASPGASVVPWVPALRHFTIADDGLAQDWSGAFVWLNPPYGLRRGNMAAWLAKFIENRDGIAMLASNTYTGWWQRMAISCDAVLYVRGYVNGHNPARTKATRPSFGTCLFALGERGVTALRIAAENGLGHLSIR